MSQWYIYIYIYGSVRLIALVTLCTRPEGKTTVVWGRGALGNFATALLDETPHTPGTAWQHKPIRVPAKTVCFYQGTENKNVVYKVDCGPKAGSANRGTEKQKSLHRHGCASGFPKIHQNCPWVSKKSASVANQFFSRFFLPMVRRTSY